MARGISGRPFSSAPHCESGPFVTSHFHLHIHRSRVPSTARRPPDDHATRPPPVPSGIGTCRRHSQSQNARPRWRSRVPLIDARRRRVTPPSPARLRPVGDPLVIRIVPRPPRLSDDGGRRPTSLGRSADSDRCLGPRPTARRCLDWGSQSVGRTGMSSGASGACPRALTGGHLLASDV
jgi:hypothetical protein